MTMVATSSSPDLVLPLHPLDEAHAALSRALASLAQAQHVDWASVAAGEYRSQLAEAEVRVRRLMLIVAECHDDWHRARALAWVHGQ